jgi:hypothetical protein
MMQLKTINLFKHMLYSLSALLALATTFSLAQEVNSQVGQPIGSVDREVHVEVTGQAAAVSAARSQSLAPASKWGAARNTTTSAKPAAGTPSAHLPQRAQAPTPAEPNPMFTPELAPDDNSHARSAKLGHGPSTHVSSAAGASAPGLSSTGLESGVHSSFGEGTSLSAGHAHIARKRKRASNSAAVLPGEKTSKQLSSGGNTAGTHTHSNTQTGTTRAGLVQ